MANEIFLSYTHIKNVDGFVTKFREVLESEVIQKTGNFELSIYQDAQEIKAGDKWKDELKETLNEAKILLILYSPTWMNSEVCRWEYEYFSKDASKTIVPVIWDHVDESDVKEEAQEVYQSLNDLHYLDWSDIKYKSWDKEKKRKAAEELAKSLKKHLKNP